VSVSKPGSISVSGIDHDGVYLADRPNRAKFDANFQGFWRFLTGSSGEYYFRTLKPVRYLGRQALHVHFNLKTASSRVV
jgi:protocatechuate 3,4-dioxygenase, beta subunit